MQLNITAASTALFSTWIFVENLGLLLDAGDGVSASLGQKGRKIDHIFITHADRDHVCGLLQLHQLNARNGVPSIYYPADCGSFPALRDFVKQFDPQSGPATWNGIKAGKTVELSNGYSIETGASTHVTSEGLTKALDFTVCKTRQVLKPEFRCLPGHEIAARRKALGDDVLMETKTEKILGYSGDALELAPNHWSGVKVLIHESTFLEAETARRSHSNLPQVIEAAAGMELEALILLHFSARYTPTEIQQAICTQANCYLPKFPIFAVCPGQVVVDVLNQSPIWQPGGKN
jgi:ribonuclease Z